MRKRKFVGKMEIARMTQDVTRRHLGWKVGCWYDAEVDRFYNTQMIDRNSWFNSEALDKNEIPIYFYGSWKMEEIVMETKKYLEERGFDPEFIGKE